MLESKKGKVSLFVHRTKLAGDVAVCVDINLKVNGCCLNKLQSGWCCDAHPSGEEVACVAYSMWLNVNNVLCGDPLAVKGSKVSSTRCGGHNGRFFISWQTKGSVSGVRKSLGLAVKALTPGKLYSTYSQVVRSIGSSPNRANFNWAAAQVLSAVNAGVCCGVVGNIALGKTMTDKHGPAKPKRKSNLVRAVSTTTKSKPKKKLSDQEKLDAMVAVVSKKLNPGDVSSPKTKPESNTTCEHKNVSVIKVNGWEAFVIKEYIMAKERGVVPIVCDRSLLVNVKESSWKPKAAKLKKNAVVYVKTRYAKVGYELGPVMAYSAIASGAVSCYDTKSLLRGVVKADQVVSAIKSNI